MTHPELVTKLKKNGKHILTSLDEVQCDLLHMTMGICGEAGELLDAIKKHTMYEQPLDFKNVVEELGDLEFYMEGLRQTLGLSREETLKANIEKLLFRYQKEKFTNEEAKERKDKN